MRNKLFIQSLLMLSGILIFTSCGNTANNPSLKSPVQSSTDTTSSKTNRENGEHEANDNTNNASTPADAKIKTTENIQAAFKGETTASAKYAAYAQKAEKEGYHEIALLFKAASTAENIHANNHKAVLQESGVQVALIKPEFTVKSTKENLEDAIAGETYEASIMYPDFLTTANIAGDQLALISLNYAYKTEKKHKVMYETALIALQNNNVKSLPSIFYVCPTCGNTYDTKAPARCGISMTFSQKFISINSL